MVVIEEEFTNKHFRKLTIKTQSTTVYKKDVYCNIPTEELEKGELIISEKMSDSLISVYRLEIKNGTTGIVLCVDSDCKLIDVLAIDENPNSLENTVCR
jgi:hypothetical protein